MARVKRSTDASLTPASFDIHQRTLADGILILHHVPGDPLLSLRQRDTFDPINKEIVHDFPHVAGFLVFYHTEGRL